MPNLTCVKHVLIVHGEQTNHPRYPCEFRRWTLTHGFYVAMGGLRVARPHDLNDNPFVEEQKIAKSDFLAPHRILELVERPGDAYRTARFDLLAQVGVAPVSQVLEANNMSLSIFGLRLLYFVAKVFERRHSGLAVAPLEVLTVAHVLMAFCITTFWWCKPSYLREGVVLDNLTVEGELPGVSGELRARAAGRQVQDAYAYTRPSRWGLRPWHRPDDNYLTLRGAANYRALIVFPLCICYATIPLLPTWELQFPNPTYSWLWRGSLSVLCGFGALVTVLTLLDTSARQLASHCATFRTFWGSEDDSGSRFGNTVVIRRYVNYMLYLIAGVALICMAVMYVVAAVGFQEIPKDVLIAGTNIWSF